jgi:NADPH:quinone reductase-like Zn-dependent oxidoreductase
VIGTASRGKKDLVESLGAIAVPYEDRPAAAIEALAPDGVDGVLDLVGGEALRDLASLMRQPARLVTAVDPVAAAEYGGALVEHLQGAAAGEMLRELARLAGNGTLDPMVTRTFPFEQAAQAVAELEAGHTRGKLALVLR